MTHRQTNPGQRPLILITADYSAKGAEFGDPSLSLSWQYAQAVMAAGGLPVALAHSDSPDAIAAYVARADGVLMTGGDDVDPDVHSPDLPDELKRLAHTTADGGLRDRSELLVLGEVFRQRKPLMAVCRGHQLLNVAHGGTLIVDLPKQRPSEVNHQQMDRDCEKVHDVRVDADSTLARITGLTSLGINSTHHQAVDRVGSGLRAVAWSADGVVEALEQAPDNQVLPFLASVQWHPERLQAAHAEQRAIFGSFIAACANRRES